MKSQRSAHFPPPVIAAVAALTAPAAWGQAIKGDMFADAVNLGFTVPVEHVRPADAPLTFEDGEETEDITGSHWLTWVCPSSGVFEARGLYPKESYEGIYLSGMDPVVRAYTGDAVPSLKEVGYVPLGIVTEPKRFRAEAGVRYSFRTGLSPFGGYIVPFSGVSAGLSVWGTIPKGNFTFTLKKQSDSPPHDDFANAAVIPAGDTVTVTGSNAGASCEPGEAVERYRAGDTVWHRWTAENTARYELLLTSPAFLGLDILTGDSLTNLVRQRGGAPNYNDPTLGTVRVRVSAQAGETRYIRLKGNGYGQQGTYTLNVRRMASPANDDAANASLLEEDLPLTAKGSTVDGSTEAGLEGDQATAASSIWWKWTPAVSRWCELRGDAAVGVLENGRRMGYTLENHSPVRFHAMAGRTYLLRAATPESAEREVTITLSGAPGLEHSTAETALDMGAGASFSTSAVPVSGGLFVNTSGDTANAALWCRWTAPATGWVSLSTEGSSNGGGLNVRAADEARTLLAGEGGYPYALFTGGGAVVNYAPALGPNFSSPTPVGPLRRALPETMVQDSSLAPVAERLLLRVTAGKPYLFEAVAPRTDSAGTLVKISLRPASAPPQVVSAVVRNSPPATAGESHFAEVNVEVSSPNGLVRGDCLLFGTSVTFTDTDRVSGDIWSGIYRVVIPVPFGFSSGSSPSLEIKLRDTRGGLYQSSTGDPFPVTGMPSAWKDLTADSIPPALEGVRGLPDQVVLNGEAVTFPLHIGVSDLGGSGFEAGEVFFESSEPGSDAVRSEGASFGEAQRVGGDASLGLYEVSVTIPAQAAGKLVCRLRDRAGNVAGGWEYTYPDWWNFSVLDQDRSTSVDSRLVVVGSWFRESVSLPVEVTQNGAVDRTAPVVSDSAAALDPSGNARLSATLTDAASGVEGGEVLLADAFGVVVGRARFGAEARVSGTAVSGKYEVTVPAPKRGYGGAHYLSWEVRDAVGNTARVKRAGTVTLPDRTADDQRRPRLTRFQLSPAAVDLTTGPAEVTVALAASDDRPGISAVCRILDSVGHLLAEERVGCEKPVLDCVSVIKLPARRLIGVSSAARVELILTDASGREARYGGSEDQAWPDASEVSLTLGPVTEPFAAWSASWPGLPALSADDRRDSDGDGVPDLLEFALGTNPLAPPASDVFRARIPQITAPPVIQLGDPAPDYEPARLVNFSCSPAPAFSRSGDHYTLGAWKLSMEESADLLTWTPAPLGDRFADAGVLHTTRVASSAAARRVFRLRISP